MPFLDDTLSPFDEYPGYGGMAPCMRECDDYMGFNGCDSSRCWCKKANLDLRIEYLERCASSSCTFANMDTATDLSTLSNIQVSYCADAGFTLDMNAPATTEATPTATGATETGSALATATETGLRDASRTRPTSGPAATSGVPSATSLRPTASETSPSGTTSSSSSSSTLSAGAKAGIGIGATFCALLALLILVLLFRRRRKPAYPNTLYPPPPSQIPPTPYTTAGPLSPQMQHPAPLHIPPSSAIPAAANADDVSPVGEKTPAFTTATITRRQVGSGRRYGDMASQASSPKLQDAVPAPASAGQPQGPREVQGSLPPVRHEVGSEREVTPAPSYSGRGEAQWAYGEHGYVHELPGGQQQQQQQDGELQGHMGGHYGRAYELGSGR